MALDYPRMYREVCAERDELREQVQALREALGCTFTSPSFVHLTSHETRLFNALLATRLLTKAHILTALYNGMPDEPEQKIVDVYVCKIRRKLKPFGIEIDTIWGRGYCMSDEMKQRVRELEVEYADKRVTRPLRGTPAEQRVHP